ncbi:MAG: FKBP-type peptidyl-prolyl cis-trans isomerase [Pseudomonadales bacterium]
MKHHILLVVAIGTALIGCNQQTGDQPTDVVQTTEAAIPAGMSLDSEEKRISYGMGIGFGQRIKQDPFSIDINAFVEGFQHALEGSEQLMTQEEIQQEMQAFQQKQIAKQKAENEKLANDNKVAGEAFLAENGTKEGIVTLESGLQYKVVTAGTGTKPAATDTVEVHYTGTLVDGTEFDSSYKRGSTVSFPVNGVIPGWTEALQLMPVGSKWQLFIPSGLAYGPGGTSSGPIGPNATLIFDVELVSIKEIKGEGDSEGDSEG